MNCFAFLVCQINTLLSEVTGNQLFTGRTRQNLVYFYLYYIER